MLPTTFYLKDYIVNWFACQAMSEVVSIHAIVDRASSNRHEYMIRCARDAHSNQIYVCLWALQHIKINLFGSCFSSSSTFFYISVVSSGKTNFASAWLPSRVCACFLPQPVFISLQIYCQYSLFSLIFYFFMIFVQFFILVYTNCLNSFCGCPGESRWLNLGDFFSAVYYGCCCCCCWA